ncbi:MAG: phenylacetate--CoA ligase family protein [Promethearchaeota archaeon]
MRKFITIGLISILRKSKLKSVRELIKSQYLSLAEIKEIQNKKFISLINNCKKNVPYYKNLPILNKIKNMDDIKYLPFLTKKDIRNNFDDLMAKNLPKKYFMLNSTSGSTGEKLIFFSDSRNVINFGIVIRNNMWTGWDFGEKQVYLWGSQYDISEAKKFINNLKNRLIHRKIFFSSYVMKEKDMYIYWKKFNSFKPKLITAYTTGLFIFSRFLEKNGLNIYRPRGIICSAETLFEIQRKKIESVFNCKVYNRYGCREVGNIAHQCERQGGLHINAEHLIVEIINENGIQCKPGELGEIVITDLDNYVFPFVRYKIGDIGIISDKECPCGRGLPLLERVEGRIFDIILGTNGNKLTGNFWTTLLRTFVKGIKQFQVIQEKLDTLTLKLIVDKEFDLKNKNNLIMRIKEKCGNDMKINFQLVDKIPLTESGKHRFIISKISPYLNNKR